MLTKELQAEYDTAKAYLATAPDPAKLRAEANEMESQAKGMLATLKGVLSDAAHAEHVNKHTQARMLRVQAIEAEREISLARRITHHAESLLHADDALRAAQRQWKQASASHVDSTQAVRKAEEELARVRDLLEREQDELVKAKGVRRGSILAELGLGMEAGKPVLSVADIEARIEALESVLPQHQGAVEQAKAQHQHTDSATRAAERAILAAKASQAERDEALAFEQFQAAHLKAFAASNAAGQQLYLRHDWQARVYGINDQMVPLIARLQAELVSQAEQGE
ncbi:hypothetical protein WAE61_08970 [Comamonadaceae bacterium PP-2]